MSYEEIKNKFKGRAVEREAMRKHLIEQVEAKRREEERIKREISETTSGKWDFEASEKVQTLRFDLQEASRETTKAQRELDKFDGDIVASVVENMKI